MQTQPFPQQLLTVQDMLISYAFSLTSNKEDAKDLCQDTILKVMKNYDKYTEDLNFNGWLFRIMRNIFINNYHRSSRFNASADYIKEMYLDDLRSDYTFAPADYIYERDEIMSIIDGLNDDLRIPLVMHMEGYKYSEISKEKELPIGTVKSRIFLARKKLKNSLKDYISKDSQSC